MKSGTEDIIAAAAARGLSFRGGFAVEADDQVPLLPDGRPAQTLLLFGNIGSDLWAAFTAAAESTDGKPDPLNRWSERLLGEIAGAVGGAAHYPFGGPPYVPFLRWAQRAEALSPSPLGMLIHPEFGLWHAYRGALAFAQPLDLPPRPRRASPCETCVERPCLSACPVSAFTPAGYDVPECVAHIQTAAGTDCMDSGCRARRACPIGREFTYNAAQSRFHMEAFLRARLAAADEREP